MNMLFLLSNPIFMAFRDSDLFGKCIFISLFILSIITWTVFLKKFFIYRDSHSKGKLFLSAFKKRQKTPLALEIGPVSHPYATIYRTLKVQASELLEQRSFAQATLSANDYEVLTATLTSTISSQEKKMNKHLFILSTVISLAPFLGLLGTVWGILLTFDELQTLGSTNTNATIMGGLAMALGTTVVGLLVAIPALISYNYLKSTLLNFVMELEDFGNYCIACIKLYYEESK